MPKAAVIMGSKSDIDVCKPAVEILQRFGVETAVRVISAHRTPDAAREFAANAEGAGFEVLIAAAGKAAHLAGVLAGGTTLPVIGIPVKSSFMDGLDSLLSVAQMPAGVPVATVAVNGGENAGLLALQILGLKYGDIADKLKSHKREMAERTADDDNAVCDSFRRAT
jgi:5-(carboxyamino)imidazole ribonucleotide mutase